MSDMYSPYASTGRLAQGTRLNGIFEIDLHIASGGMGEIYRGHAIETGDAVAIKVMRSDLADNTMALALFRKEASALHYIQHDAIIRYYVFSLDPGIGRHYLAMEFVDGQPLSDLLKSGPLTFEAALNLLERLASGLAAAHQHGIIHRDLSPDNILVPGGDVGRAKIIDFGIARSTRSNDGTIIGSGFAGKFNYVSPEQLGLFGGDVTAKSDIYSLGLVIAECLVGQPINMGGSQFDVLEKRRTVPDLKAINAHLRPLIERMLQPDPKDRPESMAAVAVWRPPVLPVAAVEKAAEALQISQPFAKKSTLGALAAAFLLLLAGGGYYLFGGSSSTTLPAENVTAHAPVLNPDGSADARQAEDARRTAAENLAKQRAEEAKRIAEAKTKSEPGRVSTTDRPSNDPVERIRQFVNSYDGGDCFFVAPVTVAEGNATLEGYGRSATPFAVLDFEFKRSNGFEASVGYHMVTPPQCAAISFVGRLRNQRGPTPRLDVSAGNLRSNGYVSGFVSDFGNRNVELLMVDHEGIVLSLTSLLKGDGDPRSFTINLKRGDAGPPKLQLLFALVTSKPLESLKPRQPGSMELGTADEVFARVYDEGLKSGQPVDVRITSFNLEK
jgi:eukaryotic-like serine/threonine-protein kinase